jgi:hypothetical protein
MKNTLVFLPKTSVLVLLFALSSGCKIFLPAHPNSHAKQGKVKIEAIDTRSVMSGTDEFGKSFVANYEKAFGHEPGVSRDKDPLTATLASAAVGIVVDQIAKELEKEAKQYEAQFVGDKTITDFWSEVTTNGGTIPKYCGLRVTRGFEKKGKTEQRFEFVCGWEYVESAGLWIARPLQFQTSKAKAKVISGKWYHQLLVAPWLLRYPGTKINSEIELEMKGYYREGELMKEVPMGVLKFKVEDYDLNTTKVLSVTSTNLEPNEVGPFNSAPVPIKRDKTPNVGPNRGMFTVTARVTESDVSNVAKSIEKAGKFVADQKKDLREKVEGAINPDKKDDKKEDKKEEKKEGQ